MIRELITVTFQIVGKILDMFYAENIDAIQFISEIYPRTHIT